MAKIRYAPSAGPALVGQALRFLDVLFGRLDSGFVELRAFPPKEKTGRRFRQFYDRSAFAGLVEDALRWASTHDVYVGLAARRSGDSGGKATVAAAGVLWADIDCGDGHHKGDVTYATTDEALAAVEALEQPPALVVRSGGGLHVYWRLEEPVDASTPAAQRDVEALLRRLAVLVAPEGRAADLQVCEVARVMRLPGTFNHKAGERRPVVIARATSAETAVAELVELLPPDPALRAPAPPRVHCSARSNGAEGLLPCMRKLIQDGAEEGERHACRLRAAVHLERAGLASVDVEEPRASRRRGSSRPPKPDETKRVPRPPRLPRG